MNERERWRQPIRLDRVRQVPRGFGWVDHRLVRDRYVDKCTAEGLALYLFLVTVADAQGVSWWAERTIGERLRLARPALRAARDELAGVGLVAYEAPRWQVLALASGGDNEL